MAHDWKDILSLGAGALLCYEATSSLFRAVSLHNWKWLLMRSMVCKLSEGCEETLVFVETAEGKWLWAPAGCGVGWIRGQEGGGQIPGGEGQSGRGEKEGTQGREEQRGSCGEGGLRRHGWRPRDLSPVRLNTSAQLVMGQNEPEERGAGWEGELWLRPTTLIRAL